MRYSASIQVDNPSTRLVKLISQSLTNQLYIANREWLSRYSAPPLYASGVVYGTRREQIWAGIPRVLSRGVGDCKDLCAWRAAELWHRGVDAIPLVVEAEPSGFHVVVRWPNGRVEDPSYILGMR